MAKGTETDLRQRLVSFLERSRLEEALSKITASMRQRGVLVETLNRFTKAGPQSTLLFRSWHDGFEHTFRVVLGVDRDNQIYVRINNLEPFTEATLPTGVKLHQLLIEQASQPIMKQLR